MPEVGFSDSARKSAGTARKIKNRFGMAAYIQYRDHGVIPAGLDSTPTRASRMHHISTTAAPTAKVDDPNDPSAPFKIKALNRKKEALQVDLAKASPAERPDLAVQIAAIDLRLATLRGSGTVKPTLPPLNKGPKAVATPPSKEVVDMFKRISKNGISVDMAGLDARVGSLQSEAIAAQIMLDEKTDFDRLKLVQPKFFKKDDQHFNARSKEHVNAWLIDHGEKDTHSIANENLRKRLPSDLAEMIINSKSIDKSIADLGILKRHTDIDGRVRPEWVEAITGRWYTGSPPIQTLSKEVRNFLTAGPGNVLYAIDWKAQELRILAKLSGEVKA